MFAEAGSSRHTARLARRTLLQVAAHSALDRVAEEERVALRSVGTRTTRRHARRRRCRGRILADSHSASRRPAESTFAVVVTIALGTVGLLELANTCKPRDAARLPCRAQPLAATHPVHTKAADATRVGCAWEADRQRGGRKNRRRRRGRLRHTLPFASRLPAGFAAGALPLTAEAVDAVRRVTLRGIVHTGATLGRIRTWTSGRQPSGAHTLRAGNVARCVYSAQRVVTAHAIGTETRCTLLGSVARHTVVGRRTARARVAKLAFRTGSRRTAKSVDTPARLALIPEGTAAPVGCRRPAHSVECSGTRR